MSDYCRNYYSISKISCHIVWSTKYRYKILKGDLQERCRDLLVQICDATNVCILRGEVGKDYVHMHIEYPLSLSVSILVKKIKGLFFPSSAERVSIFGQLGLVLGVRVK